MRIKYIFICMALVLSNILLGACSKDDDTTPDKVPASLTGVFVDERDGNEYKWVRYGSQDWMAENFRYDLNIESQCLLYKDGDGHSMDVKKYGRLYTFVGAKAACPEGWRLPTDEDWKTLEKSLGMSSADADAYDWRGNIAHNMLTAYNDTCDLNIQLSGYYTENTTMGTTGFRFMGVYGFYWTSTPDEEKVGDYYFYRKFVFNSDAIYRQSIYPGQFLSVRYVRDAQ